MASRANVAAIQQAANFSLQVLSSNDERQWEMTKTLAGVAEVTQNGVFRYMPEGSRIEEEIQATMSALHCDRNTAVETILAMARRPQAPTLDELQRMTQRDLQSDEDRDE